MNQITIQGNLGRDAEPTVTKTGKTVTNLTVAHTPREKRGNEWVDGETMWFKVPVWDDLPGVMFSKGVKVIVSGQLAVEVYKTADGVDKQSLVIKNATVGIVHRFNNAKVSAPNTDWAVKPVVSVVEEIPF